MSTCEVAELRFQDGPSNKFYRTYTCDDWWLVNWGRIGTTGQFKLTLSLSNRDAMAEARQKRDEKYAKGYIDYGQATISLDAVTANAVRTRQQRQMERLFTMATGPLDAAARRAPTGPTPIQNVSPSQAEAQRTEKLKRDLLRMAGKLVDPPAPVNGTTDPAAPKSMQDRLAEALEKAAMKP